MNQTVRFERSTGTKDFSGKPAYDPPADVPARFAEKQQLVANATGAEVTSTAEALMAREPRIGDKVNGRQVQSRKSIVARDGTVLGWKAYL